MTTEHDFEELPLEEEDQWQVPYHPVNGALAGETYADNWKHAIARSALSTPSPAAP